MEVAVEPACLGIHSLTGQKVLNVILLGMPQSDSNLIDHKVAVDTAIKTTTAPKSKLLFTSVLIISLDFFNSNYNSNSIWSSNLVINMKFGSNVVHARIRIKTLNSRLLIGMCPLELKEGHFTFCYFIWFTQWHYSSTVEVLCIAGWVYGVTFVKCTL